MVAGFECDEEIGSISSIAGTSQSLNFSVGLAWALVISLADDLTIPNNQRADHGVRIGSAQSPLGQTKRLGHELDCFIGNPGFLSGHWVVRFAFPGGPGPP
jgi:hypothetical protein